jgi:hypothetical protein
MNKENLQSKEYETWNEELILKILGTEMTVRDLISELNKICTKQIKINKSTYDFFSKYLLGLRADGKVECKKVIENIFGKTVDSIWKTVPVHHSMNLRKQRQSLMGNLTEIEY